MIWLVQGQNSPSSSSLTAMVNLGSPDASALAPELNVARSCKFHPGGGTCPEETPCCLNGYCSGKQRRVDLLTDDGRAGFCEVFKLSAAHYCFFVPMSADDPRYCSTGCEPKNSWKETSCFPKAFCSNLHEDFSQPRLATSQTFNGNPNEFDFSKSPHVARDSCVSMTTLPTDKHSAMKI